MAVGWGYGANMLTKYLSEVGDNTPLTAATCIDNPFDLEVASRSLSNNRAVDQKFAEGLVDILKSNRVSKLFCALMLQEGVFLCVQISVLFVLVSRRCELQTKIFFCCF